MDERLAIRINHGMGEDAVLGKARARILKALWRMRLGERPPAATEDDTPAGETVVSVAEPPAIAGPTQPAEPSKLDRWAMALDEATDRQSLLAASAAFEWTDADGPDRDKARDMYAARKKAVGK
jgi:hypothetical protein